MEFEDTPLLRKLQKSLSNRLGVAERAQLRSVLNCQKPLITSPGVIIAMREDNKVARLHGMSHCGNAWFCPVCAKRVANAQAKAISLAIEETKKDGLVPIMMTLTAGHLNGVPLQPLLDGIAKAWEMIKNKWRCKASKSPFSQFFREVKIHHYVKATEINWSHRFGWHPHFHLLLFIAKNDLKKVAPFEEGLAKEWQNTCERYIIKCVNSLFGDSKEGAMSENLSELQTDARARKAEVIVGRVQQVYRESKAKGLYFSKDDKGQIRPVDCAQYVAGWGGANEVSRSHFKHGQEFGHYTVMQLVEKAFERLEDVTTVDAVADNAPDLYLSKVIEIIRAVRKKHTRFSWGRTGLKTKIDKMIKAMPEAEFKKKFGGKDTILKWKILAFVPSSLLQLCWNDDQWVLIEKFLIHLFKVNRLHYESICEVFNLFGYNSPLPTFLGHEYLEDGKKPEQRRADYNADTFHIVKDSEIRELYTA